MPALRNQEWHSAPARSKPTFQGLAPPRLCLLTCRVPQPPPCKPTASPSSGSKQLQFVAGVPAHLYWLASWLWDGFMYLVVLACTMASRRHPTNPPPAARPTPHSPHPRLITTHTPSTRSRPLFTAAARLT